MKTLTPQEAKQAIIALIVTTSCASGLAGFTINDIMHRREAAAMRARYDDLRIERRNQTFAICQIYNSTVPKNGRNAELDSICNSYLGEDE